jgi:Co/Zn/Cd efflux system component
VNCSTSPESRLLIEVIDADTFLVMEQPPEPPAQLDAVRLKRTVLIVAAVNFGYFFVEFSLAWVAGSVSLLADSVDFLEDTSINLLIFIALGWPLTRRSHLGKVMALVILAPAALAGWEAIHRLTDPQIPDVTPLVVASLGAIAVNGTSAWLLARVRHHGGSLSAAAFLSARNDVLVNLAIITMGIATIWVQSGWPDLILGCVIIALALRAAWEVWEISEEERLAAKALTGEPID